MDLRKLSAARFQVLVRTEFPPWSRVAYLIPDIFRQSPELMEGVAEVIMGKDEKFNAFVQTEVEAYINEGVMPAADIAAPIINLSEDVMAGRPPTIRAGDYIAIQTHLRK